MDQEGKKSYLSQLADQLKDLDAKLDELKAKAKDATAGTTAGMKADYEKASVELKKMRADAEAKIEELKKSSGEGWEEIKKGADKAVKDLSEAFNSALGKFKK